MKFLFHFLIVFSALLAPFHPQAIENSIIPLMEKYENPGHLPRKKYSFNQWKEITEALEHKEEKIRIVTYNMLFNLYDHNLEEENRWPQRFPRILELLNEMQPDIIGVQELYNEQLQHMLEAISETYAFFGTPCEDGELNGIFYRKNRFEVIESKVWFMTSTPQKPRSETLTMVQLKDVATGKVFGVFNAHLAFSKIEKREFQARFIVKHLHAVAEEMPVLFMGDLNTFPQRLEMKKLPFYDGDYIHRILTQGALREAREYSLLGHLGPISTFTNGADDGIPFKGRGTPGVFLDHIYVTKGVIVLLHAVQPATVGGHFPSDHMPVLIDCLLQDAEY